MLAEQKLNQVNVQFVMQETQSLVNAVIAEKLQQVSQVLTENNLDPDILLAEVLENDSHSNIFQNLHNQRAQNTQFISRLGMIEPKVTFLPFSADDFGRYDTGRRQRFRIPQYMSIPFFDQLQRILNFPDVLAEIRREKTFTPGVWSTYEDGENFKKIPIFQLHPEAIQIHLYLDEVQMCTEVGNHTKKNKLVFVYFSIGNLPIKFRSTFRAINVLAIIYNNVFNRYGANVILKPIVEDFKKLEQGVELTISGEQRKVYGTLAAVSADNLASHQIGGFKIGFGFGFRKCRFCMATADDIQSKFFDYQHIPRSINDHNFHCSGIANENLRDHCSRLYGIREQSVLNELNFFHVIGGLVPDVMHDVLEGSLPLTICELLYYCIATKKYFTLAQLNNIIDKFDYGHIESKNKPSHIEWSHIEKRKLRQSAAQIWTLAINLPLMIGVKVTRNDPRWFCLTVLLEICRLIFLTSITSFQLNQLEFLIDEFLTDFKYNFGRRIIPKMHHLIHYPRIIREIGPLGAFWCMRYEAKHSYFKQLQRKIRNYINIPYTLSLRHQQWQCYHFARAGVEFLKIHVDSKSKKLKSHLTQSKCAVQIAQFFNLDNVCNVVVDRLNWITKGRTMFKVKDSFILCSFNNNSRQFGLIVDILLLREHYFFICKIFRTVKFYNHLQAFRLRERNDDFHIAVSYSTLPDFHVYCKHKPAFHRPKSLDVFITCKIELSLSDD